jgi:hypothetical protein
MAFWNDLWDVVVLKWKYPELSSFRKKSLSVQQFLNWDPGRSFFMPLSQQAHGKLEAVLLDIQQLALSPSAKDVWTYIWGSSDYICKKAYISLSGNHPASILFKWMW